VSGWWFEPTPLKNMSWSVGVMTFPIYGEMKLMFQSPPTSYSSKICVLYQFTTSLHSGNQPVAICVGNPRTSILELCWEAIIEL